MSSCYLFIASARYWPDSEEQRAAFDEMRESLVPPGESAVLLNAGEEFPEKYRTDTLVVVPMSGAVQADILRISAQFRYVILYAGYVKGNTQTVWADRMLLRNAAPTLMDCWSVLRRTHPAVQLAQDRRALSASLLLANAARAVTCSKLLLIGDTEPWVISASRDFTQYAAFGVTIEQIPQSELIAFYEQTDFDDSAACDKIYRHFTKNSVRKEPDETDLRNACRMAAAFCTLLEKHQADGAAVACFNLLKIGTTCCLGVSYINDCTGWIAACEGDLDSAVTMLLLKKLGVSRFWMANPALSPGDCIQFSHCTAPVWPQQGIILRSHHESGIGVSIQSELPEGPLTACRISAMSGAATVQTGTAHHGERLPVCRSQIYVNFADVGRYLQTSLGCHQVFAFEDCAEKMIKLTRMLGIQIEE